jgi:hypothetical protein
LNKKDKYMKKIILACCICLGCSASKTSVSQQQREKITGEAQQTSGLFKFKEGIPAYAEKKVAYTQAGTTYTIDFKKPVVVGVAAKPEKWGFFQFPSIARKPDGNIQVKWNMARDAIEAYGQENYGSASSSDHGKTWTLQNSAETTGLLKLPSGDELDVVNPKPIKVEDLKLPKPVGQGLENYRKSNFTFYRLHDMPESRQGIFFMRLKKGEKEWKPEQAKLYDPDAARYSLAGLVPVLFWGDMKIAKDKSLIAGIYPGFLIGKDGTADPRSGVFFYRSTDNGNSWTIQGRIPFVEDAVGDPFGSKRMGFTEPAFEILKDGTYLCVLRTTDGAGVGPMYASYSKDMGKTWTRPRPIAGAGVLPRLLQLENGVLVLASGRPGVQLRFSTDGRSWTDSFEMLPHSSPLSNELGWQANISDGYTGLLPLAKNRFLLVYSDFNYKTASGEIRKSIKVREITVATAP